MKFYGSHLCPDCEAAQAVLDREKIPYEYVDITGSMANLKEFLKKTSTGKNQRIKKE